MTARSFQDMLNEYLPNSLLKEELIKRDYILTRIKKDNKWKGQRHELFSVPFVSALSINENEKIIFLTGTAYQKRQAENLMLAGATLRDPSRIDVRGEITVGQEVIIDVNCIFEGKVTIADGVVIGANSILKNCSIGLNTEIKPNSIIEEATIGEHCTLGPFARIRPGSVMKDDSHVGNFVEMKKTTLGEGAKAGHLAYLGDSDIGARVNIGAGTITCNYDGVNKFKTIIGEGAFIGSNSSIVAPANIGAMATIGAGSVIVKDVEQNDLSVARGKQRNIANWSRPVKK